MRLTPYFFETQSPATELIKTHKSQTMPFSIGDILRGRNRNWDAAYHPIIFIKDSDQPDYFIGVMLTHSPGFGNIRLADEHIQDLTNHDPRDKHFVGASLLKRNDWGPFAKVGELSPLGVEYVLSNIDLENPLTWEDHIG